MPFELYSNVEFKAFSPFNLRPDYSEGAFTEANLEIVDQRKQIFDVWGFIVKDYSGLALTYPEDKLVAISAIAKEMKSLMRCRYLAGHWEKDMVRQLAWSGYSSSACPTTYLAPSWSWASVDALEQAIFLWMYRTGYQHFPLIEILTAHIDLASEDDETGPVTGGYLDVLGRLFQMDAEELGEGEEEQKKKEKQQKEDQRGDKEEIKEEHSDPEWGVQDRPCLIIQGLRTKLRLSKDRRYTRLNGPLYCIFLFLSYGDTPLVKGIALKQAGMLNVYRPVGLIEPDFIQDLRRDDPILGLLGDIEWKDDGNHTFLPDKSGMQTIRLI
ncbi:MAG: hypothetical protein Q9225_007130 [Loekoesia sp. 1 TL-2023]